MKLTLLGTGYAFATECYNTCFVIEGDDGRLFMVDGGGGNGLLTQLERASYNWMDIREIFVTHKHIDHIMGIVWMMRLICQHMKQGQYDGEASIYARPDVIELLHNLAGQLLAEKELGFLDTRLHLTPVENGETRTVIGKQVTFFDIESTKAPQFGFRMQLDEDRFLTCCGDEPYSPCEERYAKNATWLLHEAYCLYEDAAELKPYEKHHTTVKDACELAEQLNVENLVLYHTEDGDLPHRKARYTEEGRRSFAGNLLVPDDLETIEL